MLQEILQILAKYSLVTAFILVGATVCLSNFLSAKLTGGRLHGSAIALVFGLALAYLGGLGTGGKNGLSDVPAFAGIGLLGGSMLRDLAIVATAHGARLEELRRAGFQGILALFTGISVSFFAGGCVAWAFGYRSAEDITTIGAGTATFIVGPVTGAAVGAGTDVIALSVAAGVIKSILVMIATPFVAPFIGLDNPRSAMVFGGLLGTTSGVAGGLAATNPALVPYGAITATFYTGLGCLLGPSVFFFMAKLLL